jgi:hypothetical protein
MVHQTLFLIMILPKQLKQCSQPRHAQPDLQRHSQVHCQQTDLINTRIVKRTTSIVLMNPISWNLTQLLTNGIKAIYIGIMTMDNQKQAAVPIDV